MIRFSIISVSEEIVPLRELLLSYGHKFSEDVIFRFPFNFRKILELVDTGKWEWSVYIVKYVAWCCGSPDGWISAKFPHFVRYWTKEWYWVLAVRKLNTCFVTLKLLTYYPFPLCGFDLVELFFFQELRWIFLFQGSGWIDLFWNQLKNQCF